MRKPYLYEKTIQVWLYQCEKNLVKNESISAAQLVKLKTTKGKKTPPYPLNSYEKHESVRVIHFFLKIYFD